MTKKQRVLYYLKNTYARLKPSGIEGVGVFAIRDISKNTKIFLGQHHEPWYSFKTSDLKDLDLEILKMIDDFFVIEENQTLTIPAAGLNGIDMSFYLNNSDKPNIKTIDGGFTFVSKRDIKKGEELTVSYAQYDYKFKNFKNKHES